MLFIEQFHLYHLINQSSVQMHCGILLESIFRMLNRIPTGYLFIPTTMFMSLNSWPIGFKYGLVEVVDLLKNIASSLNNPKAIFVTKNGDIYVDSGNNHRVEMWVWINTVPTLSPKWNLCRSKFQFIYSWL
jgi:hypothetical protein